MPKKSKKELVARPEYRVPCKEPSKDRGVHPFETVPFGDHEFYSLDTTLARFILPRLKRFREIYGDGRGWGCFSGEGITMEECNRKTVKKLDKMIAAFQIIASDDYWDDQYDAEKQAAIKKGLKAFVKYYFCLWT